MAGPSGQAVAAPAEKAARRPFVILCASGFESVERVRSALMFSTLAASAEYDVVLYCVQSGVEVMVRGAIWERERPVPGVPTLSQRLKEAMDWGVRIMCCSQSLANKGIKAEDLLEGVEIAGAMTLISIAGDAAGTLSF